MSKLRILHITPWFPNSTNEIDGVFIFEHIKSLKPFCLNEVIHLYFGDKRLEMTTEKEGLSVQHVQLKPLINKWKLKEIAAHQFIKKYLAKNAINFDLIHFHIAYPNAIGIGKLKRQFPQLKFVITEHWSAYHHNFNLVKKNRGRKRIENIFSHDIPLITVSNSLKEDIERFSGVLQKNAFLLPNSIDTALFSYQKKTKNEHVTFVSINNWNAMKNPFVLIDAFADLQKTKTSTRLILGGYGQLIPEMKARVNELNLTSVVHFTDRLTKVEVASILQAADVYVQSSNYETFSVICAEALATGTPVIATNIGGMKDFISEENGQLVNDFIPNTWTKAMLEIIENWDYFDTEKIAYEAAVKFNQQKIGSQYATILTRINDSK